MKSKSQARIGRKEYRDNYDKIFTAPSNNFTEYPLWHGCFSVRAHKAINRVGLHTFRELEKAYEQDRFNIKGVGEKTRDELDEFLSEGESDNLDRINAENLTQSAIKWQKKIFYTQCLL